MASKLLGKAMARATEFAQRLKTEYQAGKAGDEPDANREVNDKNDAEEVASAMRGVDWAKVRAATSERSADAVAAMRSMAAEVDWAKVQPVAAKVSSALMAAVASGQLGVGGRLGGTVARAIINDRNLAQRVSTELVKQEQPMPPDFRNVIDVTATE